MSLPVVLVATFHDKVLQQLSAHLFLILPSSHWLGIPQPIWLLLHCKLQVEKVYSYLWADEQLAKPFFSLQLQCLADCTPQFVVMVLQEANVVELSSSWSIYAHLGSGVQSEKAGFSAMSTTYPGHWSMKYITPVGMLGFCRHRPRSRGIQSA